MRWLSGAGIERHSRVTSALSTVPATGGEPQPCSFRNKKAAIETVTPALDEDGRWRVSGYFIK